MSKEKGERIDRILEETKFIDQIKILESDYVKLLRINHTIDIKEYADKLSQFDENFKNKLDDLVEKINADGMDVVDLVDRFAERPDLAKAFSQQGLLYACKAHHSDILVNDEAKRLLKTYPDDLGDAIKEQLISIQVAGDDAEAVLGIQVRQKVLGIIYPQLSSEQVMELGESLQSDINNGDISIKALALNNRVIDSIDPKSPELILMNLELKQTYLKKIPELIKKLESEESLGVSGYEEDDFLERAVELFAPLVKDDEKSLRDIVNNISQKMRGLRTEDLKMQDLRSELEALRLEFEKEIKEIKIDMMLDGEGGIKSLTDLANQYDDIIKNQNQLFFNSDQEPKEQQDHKFTAAKKEIEDKIGQHLTDLISQSKQQGIEVEELTARMMGREDSTKLFKDEIFLQVCQEQNPILAANINAYKILHAGDQQSVTNAFGEYLHNVSNCLDETPLPAQKAIQQTMTIVYGQLKNDQINSLSKTLENNVREGQNPANFIIFNNNAIDDVRSKKPALEAMQQTLKDTYRDTLPELLSNLIDRDQSNDYNYGIQKPYLDIPLSQDNLTTVTNHAAGLFAPLVKGEKELDSIKSQIEKIIKAKCEGGVVDSPKVRENLCAQLKEFSSSCYDYDKLNETQVKELENKFCKGIKDGSLSHEFVISLQDRLKPISGTKPELGVMQCQVDKAYKDKLPNLLERVIEHDLIVPLDKNNLKEVKDKIRNLFTPTTNSNSQLDRLANDVEKIIIEEAKNAGQDSGVKKNILRRAKAYVLRKWNKKKDRKIVPTTTTNLLREKMQTKLESLSH